MKVIMSGRHYEVSAPGLFEAGWTSFIRRRTPLRVLTNRETGRKYKIPLAFDDKLRAVGDTYVQCERDLVWSNRDPVYQAKRASTCCDFLGKALEHAINGDSFALDELATNDPNQLADRIDHELIALPSTAAEGGQEKVPEASVDLRASPRRKAYIGALVTTPDGARVRDCVIKDVSDGGMRITIHSDEAIPGSCVLINLKDPVAHRARVVWQDPPSYGLKVIQSHDLQGHLDPKMQFAKDLWSARRT